MTTTYSSDFVDDVMPPKAGKKAKNVHYDKCPLILLLDESGSMRGESIKQLNKGVKKLKQKLMDDEEAKKTVEISIIHVKGNKPYVDKQTDFSSVEEFNVNQLSASGRTPIRQALELAVEKVSQRKKYLRQEGTNYYRPWLILITDGVPTDLNGKGNELKALIQEQIKGKHLLPWAFGTDNADMDFLKEIFSKERTFKLSNNRFDSIFEWVSNSMGVVSSSARGEKTNVPNPGNLPGISVEV